MTMFQRTMLGACLLAASMLRASEIPVADKTGVRVHAQENDIRLDTEYRDLYEEQLSRNQELQRLVEMREQNKADSQNHSLGEPIFERPPHEEPAQERRDSRPRLSGESKILPSGIQVFGSTSGGGFKTSVLPAGSFVKARLLTGVQANSRYPYDSLLQLDYAYTGPNGTKIPLQGCLILSSAKADLSIERVVMLPHTISCVLDDDRHFDRSITGFVADRDSANGLEGTYLSKQNKVFLAALLASIVKGAGEAVQMSSIQEQVSGDEKGAVARNFKGNVGQFAVAKGLTDAGGLVADWYLEQAKALLPTIGVASGRDVWIITGKTVEIPNMEGE